MMDPTCQTCRQVFREMRNAVIEEDLERQPIVVEGTVDGIWQNPVHPMRGPGGHNGLRPHGTSWGNSSNGGSGSPVSF